MTTSMWFIAAAIVAMATAATMAYYTLVQHESVFDNWPTWLKWSFWPGVGVAVALVLVGTFFLANDEANACTASGGHEVPDGPPIYIMSGNVMIPIQSYSCQGAT